MKERTKADYLEFDIYSEHFFFFKNKSKLQGNLSAIKNEFRSFAKKWVDLEILGGS